MKILVIILEINKDLLDKIKIVPLIDTLQLEDISDEEYFSTRYSNYLSNSRLSLLKTKGAKIFFEGLKQDGYNASFDFGTKLHQLVLQPESFELIQNVFKPTAKAGMVADYLYKSDGTTPTDDDIKVASIKCNYYKDKLTTNRLLEFKNKAESYWRDRFLFEQENPKTDKERLYSDQKSIETLNNCLDSLQKNVDIQKLLHPEGLLDKPYYANEKTILIDFRIEIPGYNEVIYKWKSKLDNFSIDKEENTITVNDLKTTSRLAVDFDPTYFSYQREIAIYSYLLKLCCAKFFNLENPKVKGNFLVISTIPTYNSLVYPMTPKLFKSGWEEFKYLMRTIAYLNIVNNYTFS